MCQFLIIDNLTLGRKRVRNGDAPAFNPSVLGYFVHLLSPPLSSPHRRYQPLITCTERARSQVRVHCTSADALLENA